MHVNIKSKFALGTEFIGLFFILPIALFFMRHQFAPYLFLALFTLLAWCLLILLSDRRFKRFRFWNLSIMLQCLPRVLFVFSLGAIAILMLTLLLSPQWLFVMPLQHTWMWIALLVLYPLLSAWPQELIFRTFMFHRYKTLIKQKSLRAWLSALSFALAHLIFGNWIAVVGAFFAGLIFAFTYIHSRSTLLVAFEHSLWGCWLFTAGLGVHFDSSMLEQLGN